MHTQIVTHAYIHAYIHTYVDVYTHRMQQFQAANFAEGEGDAPVLKMLLEKVGASEVNAKNLNGLTPLHWAGMHVLVYLCEAIVAQF